MKYMLIIQAHESDFAKRDDSAFGAWLTDRAEALSPS